MKTKFKKKHVYTEKIIAGQITNVRQRTHLLLALQRTMRKEANKMGLKGMPLVEVEQIFKAFIVLGEVKE
ncbi:hypothetical protein [Serratia marcescens]|uniref:hypothetical protein n=1 Tax=Serratia marcescens TaxID=615 RepID=UPI0027E48737|nr:hypothetical protein [Serratia marcescens]